ncbi:esterase-like activity of phytase family protein [Parvibaculum sp. MBR-TMA-1.3b-4.2]
MRELWWRVARGVALALLVAGGIGNAAFADGEIDVEAHPLIWNPDNRQETKTGDLEWAGGVELTSPDGDFGGWSGLSVSADGSRLLAISDKGRWLSGRLLYDERGRIYGVADAHIAPMLGLDGKPVTRTKQLGDAEGLTVDGDDPLASQAYVSFERAHRIWKYDIANHALAAKPLQLLTQRRLGRLAFNGGIEALAWHPARPGKDDAGLVAITEDTLNPRGNIRAFLAEGRDFQRFEVKPRAPYKPTDLARLPNGDYLLLERRFSILGGVGMEIRYLKSAALTPGALVDGPVLIDVGQSYSIDNMEGLSARSDGKGGAWLYMISDDNFNPIQRTLLLMFHLPADTMTRLHGAPKSAEAAETPLRSSQSAGAPSPSPDGQIPD